MNHYAWNSFLNMFAPIAAIVLGIMILTIFFRINSWLSRNRGIAIRTLTFPGLLEKNTPVIVHLNNGKTVDDVYWQGIIDAASPKHGLPHEFNDMVIFENSRQKKIMIRAKAIRMIEEMS